MAIYKLAASMILVHNHPSGALEPSEADLNFTDRMIKVGQLLKVSVVDHLIISETNFESLVENGEINKLKKSGTYEILTREQVELNEGTSRRTATCHVSWSLLDSPPGLV